MPLSHDKLQLVQNTAARIIRLETKTRKFADITLVVISLYWLPVHARSDYKILLLTYKMFHRIAPFYL